MPKQAHTRLSMIGTLGTLTTPKEQWSCGFTLPGIVATTEAMTALADAAIVAWDAHMKTLIRSTAQLREAKVALIGADGQYTREPVIRPTTVAGTSAGGSNVFQLALVVSTATNTRGATGRGRFYLPMPGESPDNLGVLSDTYTNSVASGAAQFLRALNAVNGFGDVSVISTTGTVSPITSVRVGRVIDTMRSRRRSLDEAYSQPYAVSP